jgi:hypothetical protein
LTCSQRKEERDIEMLRFDILGDKFIYRYRNIEIWRGIERVERMSEWGLTVELSQTCLYAV